MGIHVQFKHGIIVKKTVLDGECEWRIATIGRSAENHECVLAPANIFNYEPKLGDSVKVGYRYNGDEPLLEKVVKCEEIEWVRDVEVIGNNVIIYCLLHLDMLTTDEVYDEVEKEDLYIFENGDGDIGKFSITQEAVDKELEQRSEHQKDDQKMVYRIGLFWNPLKKENLRVNWKHYRDTPLVPVFENYFRDTTVPYLSSSMLYGVQPALVIARNEGGALMWSPLMGCAVMSSVTVPDLPPLGTTLLMLTKRCLEDRSFDFPCYYELMPSILSNDWNNVQIMPDFELNKVYIQCKAQATRCLERYTSMYLDVPDIGPVAVENKRYGERTGLKFGVTYEVRLEFRRSGPDEPFKPVIVDILQVHDLILPCRIVLASKHNKTCYAIVDRSENVPENIFAKIDFVVIPPRVMFCFNGREIDEQDLLMMSVVARVTAPQTYHATVNCVLIHFLGRRPFQYNIIQKVNEEVWFRCLATYVNVPESPDLPVVLIEPKNSQLIIDQTRTSVRRNLTDLTEAAVIAQFCLAPGDIPMFVVRAISGRIRDLPLLTPIFIQNLRPISSVFEANKMSPFKMERNLQLVAAMEAGNIPKTGISRAQNIQSCSSTFSSPSPNSFARRVASPVPSEAPSNVSAEIITESLYGESVTNETTIDPERFGMDVVQESDLSATFDRETPIIRETPVELDTPIIPTEVCPSPPPTRAVTPASVDLKASASTSKASHYQPNEERSSKFAYREDYNDRYYAPRPLQRRRLGFRYFDNRIRNEEELLQIVSYQYEKERPIFSGEEKTVAASFENRINGTLKSIRIRRAQVLPVELRCYQEAYAKGKCKFEFLVSFLVQDPTLNLSECFVTIPVGGKFNLLPSGFQVGDPYVGTVMISSLDRLVRLVGYGGLSGEPDLVKLPKQKNADERAIVISPNGLRKWMRVIVRCTRMPFHDSGKLPFELWSTPNFSGLIIVDKRLINLEPLNPAVHDCHEYLCVIEPLPGGPFDVTGWENEPQHSRGLESVIMWRMVAEYRDHKDKVPPICAKKIPHEKPPEPEKPKRTKVYKDRRSSSDQVVDKIVNIRRDAWDRLPANDVRIKCLNGPDVGPMLQSRKVDIVFRKQKMMDALYLLRDMLDYCHEMGIFVDLEGNELQRKIDQYEQWHDDLHPYDFKRRLRCLYSGNKILADNLLKDKTYRKMENNLGPRIRELLLEIADCLVLNQTYLLKTDAHNRMLVHFNENMLHDYD